MLHHLRIGRRASLPARHIRLGQEIILDQGQPVPRLVLDYFEPEERDMHCRSETFTPIAVGEDAPLAGQPLPDVAIAYARRDAEVVSLHPDPPPDPVLAVRQDPVQTGALVAVYLSELPSNAPAAEVDALLSGDRCETRNHIHRKRTNRVHWLKFGRFWS